MYPSTNSAALCEGAHLLRSNISDWRDDQLWKAYIQLTRAEAAFRIPLSVSLGLPISQLCIDLPRRAAKRLFPVFSALSCACARRRL